MLEALSDSGGEFFSFPKLLGYLLVIGRQAGIDDLCLGPLNHEPMILNTFFQSMAVLLTGVALFYL